MIEREEWKKAAQSFECSLMILRKDKNGWVIGFSVHPDEAPDALLNARLGTRFRAVLFQVGDDEKPVPTRASLDGGKAVAMAGEICRRESFQEFILRDRLKEFGIKPKDERDAESQAASELRDILGISSRSELMENTSARKAFWELVREFNEESLEEISVGWDSL